MKEKMKISDLITSYGGHVMYWTVMPVACCSGNSMAIGKNGTIRIDEIEDEIYNLFVPFEGQKEWMKWSCGITAELENEGMNIQDIHRKIVDILFDGLKQQSDTIENGTYMERRPSYFLAEFDD